MIKHGSNILCFPGATTNLWEKKVYSKGCILVDEVALKLNDLFAEHFRSVADLERVSICLFLLLGPMPTPPITPKPPALVTAAANLGPAATFIPARRIGCLIFKASVRAVLISCGESIESLVSVGDRLCIIWDCQNRKINRIEVHTYISRSWNAFFTRWSNRRRTGTVSEG
jgi:hypothetical protein